MELRTIQRERECLIQGQRILPLMLLLPLKTCPQPSLKHVYQRVVGQSIGPFLMIHGIFAFELFSFQTTFCRLHFPMRQQELCLNQQPNFKGDWVNLAPKFRMLGLQQNKLQCPV